MCGVCGSTVHAGGARRHYRMYRCSGSLGHISRKAEPVEDYVCAVVVERLRRPDAVELLVDRHRPDVDELRRDADTLRQRLEQVALDYAEGVITGAQLRAATERLRQRLSDVEQRMADAGRIDVLGPLVGAADVADRWRQLDTDRQRQIIDLLMTVRLHPVGRGTGTFRPDTVDIRWRAGVA